jgi:hypothetical protein
VRRSQGSIELPALLTHKQRGKGSIKGSSIPQAKASTKDIPQARPFTHPTLIPPSLDLNANNTRTISTKETTTNMSKAEAASDTETTSEREISRAKHASVGGESPRVGLKTNSLHDVSIKGFTTGAKLVCDAVFRILFLAPVDILTSAGNQDQSQIRMEGASGSKYGDN